MNITKIFCAFGLHFWGPWEVDGLRNVVTNTSLGRNRHVAVIRFMKRVSLCCKDQQVKEQWTNGYTHHG